MGLTYYFAILALGSSFASISALQDLLRLLTDLPQALKDHFEALHQALKDLLEAVKVLLGDGKDLL